MKNQFTQKDSILTYALGFVILLVGGIFLSTLLTSGTNLYAYLAYLIPQCAYFIAIISYTKYAKLEFQLNLKINIKRNYAKYIIAIFLGAAIFFSALLLNFFLEKLYRVLELNIAVTVPSLNTALDYVLCFLLICIVPPICEELMFRKALLDGMHKMGVIKAALVSAAIFSLSHLNPVQTIYQFILGFILAIIYLKTKDVAITIIIHIVNNCLAFFLTALTNPIIWTKLSVLLLCFFIALPVTVFCLYLILKGGKVNTKEKEKISAHTIAALATMGVLWLLTAFAL